MELHIKFLSRERQRATLQTVRSPAQTIAYCPK